MSNKFAILVAIFFAVPLAAQYADSYDPSASMFQSIAELEQEKVLTQLEKEKAQLLLDMDRIALEKERLSAEMKEAQDKASGKDAEMERLRSELAAERESLSRQRAAMQNQPRVEYVPESDIANKYKLVNIVGAGPQLQASIEDISTGARRTLWVGKTIDDYTVQSISIDEGVRLSNGNENIVIGIGTGN